MFHCTRVKRRVLNVRTKEDLAYKAVLIDRVCRVTEGLIDDEQ